MTKAKYIFDLIINAADASFIAESDDIELDERFIDYSELTKQDIEFEKILGKCRITTNQIGLRIFWDEPDFLERVIKNDLERDCLIVNKESNIPIFYDHNKNKEFLNFSDEKSWLFENATYYYKTLELFEQQEHKEDHIFYFVDHFNKTLRTIIFTSLNKEGKLTISYPKGLPSLNSKKSIKESVSKLIEAFSKENKHYPKFIKSELFKSLIKEKKEMRIIKLFDNMEEVLNIAEQNFELYLTELSLDKFKTDYIEYKEKFFLQLRDILGKVTSQVLALPISLTAAAFASYKTANDVKIFALVTLVFFLYTIYATFLLRLYKYDLRDIEQTFDRDFFKLEKEEFFIKYPSELDVFNTVRTSIKNRCSNLRQLINGFVIVLTLTNVAFIYFACLEFGMEINSALVVSMTFLFISIVVASEMMYVTANNMVAKIRTRD